jgi:hypothetical protein
MGSQGIAESSVNTRHIGYHRSNGLIHSYHWLPFFASAKNVLSVITRNDGQVGVELTPLASAKSPWHRLIQIFVALNIIINNKETLITS